jgi:hypothetical protein
VDNPSIHRLFFNEDARNSSVTFPGITGKCEPAGNQIPDRLARSNAGSDPEMGYEDSSMQAGNLIRQHRRAGTGIAGGDAVHGGAYIFIGIG